MRSILNMVSTVLAFSLFSNLASAAEQPVDNYPANAKQADGLETAGDAAAASGDLSAARAAYDESLALRRELARTGDVQSMRDLSTTLYRAGALALMDGDADTASARYAGSVGLERNLLAASPDSLEAQLELSASLRGMGEVMLANGRPDASQTAFVEALAIDQRMADAHPGSVELAQNLAEGQRRLAWTIRVLQHAESAGETVAATVTPES